ncbi:MAG: class I SAM-dependent methyltransferase [Alphaproteobacteria bacterium]|nr:class I SAM-dependent methyltransferase [Alphaproteobacteria bacterium]MCL2505426.1 class I SAM-dependent methyltransferase [Alphaproteobacteria bacterium]
MSHAIKTSVSAACSFIAGIAKDFWKDGNWGAEDELDRPIIHEKPKPVEKPKPAPVKPKVTEEPPPSEDMTEWSAADRIDLLEKIWGTKQLLPMDTEMTDILLKPLNLNSNARVLDLAAGIGARMRKAEELFGVYIIGKEPNAEAAKRGMDITVKSGMIKKLPIEAYDPNDLKESRPYDCIMFREILCYVKDKVKFIKALSEYSKPNAQIVFTDFILASKMHGAAILEELRQLDAGFSPMTLKELEAKMSEHGIGFRVSEDLTEQYKEAVQEGLLRFIKFLESSITLDAKTKRLILAEINLLSKRLAALEKDIRFYRFYSTKN